MLIRPLISLHRFLLMALLIALSNALKCLMMCAIFMFSWFNCVSSLLSSKFIFLNLWNCS